MTFLAPGAETDVNTFFLTSPLDPGLHRFDHHGEARGCCRTAVLLQILYHNCCCTDPMKTRESSLRSWGTERERGNVNKVFITPSLSTIFIFIKPHLVFWNQQYRVMDLWSNKDYSLFSQYMPRKIIYSDCCGWGSGVNICIKRLYLEQFATWIVGPLHWIPPHWAMGPSHERDRHTQLLMEPSPSLWLQDCHGAQGPKPPSCVRFLTSRGDKMNMNLHQICLNLQLDAFIIT